MWKLFPWNLTHFLNWIETSFWQVMLVNDTSLNSIWEMFSSLYNILHCTSIPSLGNVFASKDWALHMTQHICVWVCELACYRSFWQLTIFNIELCFTHTFESTSRCNFSSIWPLSDRMGKSMFEVIYLNTSNKMRFLYRILWVNCGNYGIIFSWVCEDETLCTTTPQSI